VTASALTIPGGSTAHGPVLPVGSLNIAGLTALAPRFQQAAGTRPPPACRRGEPRRVYDEVVLRSQRSGVGRAHPCWRVARRIGGPRRQSPRTVAAPRRSRSVCNRCTRSSATARLARPSPLPRLTVPHRC
jgi:hypothetical protein